MSLENKEENISEKKYSKLLNNLLDIKGIDQTIFTKVNGSDSFDLTSKFAKKYSEKILSTENFTMTLEEKDLDKLLWRVRRMKRGDKVIAAFQEHKERIFKKSIDALNNPETAEEEKQRLIKKVEDKVIKSHSRWKQLERKIVDINIQDNVWPLHVATAFISIKTKRREVYAPLFLKEVDIAVWNSKLRISNIGNWKINEKLIFLLNDEGFSIDIDTKEFTLKKMNKFIEEVFHVEALDIDFAGEFENLTRQDITNEEVHFHPGVVLGIFKPSGGHLRKTMLEIIENDEVDNIIDIDADKKIYTQSVMSFIERKSSDLFRIQPSNYSQDKALASAMLQDTVIWGPPGTGKSQVIANIIANILFHEKTAIVMSQKKAALDVLKKRLGILSSFALFMLNDNNMVKSEFYKPLQKFVDMIENSWVKPDIKNSEIITRNEVDSLKWIKKAKSENKYLDTLNLIEEINDEKTISNIFSLDPKLTYSLKPQEEKKYLKTLATQNNIPKEGFWIFKNYPETLKQHSETALKILNSNQGIDINAINKLAAKTDLETTTKILSVPKRLVRTKKQVLGEKYIAQVLSHKIIERVNHWQDKNEDLYEKYKKFAAAVRAGRALPYKFVNKHMEILRELFPVIITTPETSFVKWEKDHFDYSIVDESSQMFLEIGLPILYLSKVKILAGDTEQLQPSRWFSNRDENIDEDDVAENANSLLDYAVDKGVYKVLLDKNYRSSSASLMTFSARNFYDSKLEVVDRRRTISRDPITVMNIKGKWENGVNQKEADTVIELAEKSIKSPWYNTVIILAFNSKQRKLIEKMIIEDHPELLAEIEKENLMIRNIENIQGDEADIVIATVVYDAKTNMSSTFVARPGGKNALNVAISRAKEKMIVVKSVTADKIKPSLTEDFKIFRRWLKFLDLSPLEQKTYSKGVEGQADFEPRIESDFVKEVEKAVTDRFVTSRAMKVIKKYPVGSKKIDIAIFDEWNKFVAGVEIDDYQYNRGKDFELYLEDISRQEFLENKGYTIYKIKEIDWRLNKKKTLNDLFNLIEKSL